MKKHECIIGIEYDFESTDLITLSELKSEIKERHKINDFYKETNGYDYYRKIYELEDYFNKKIGTGIEMFNYCPICGKKIEYKGEE